MKNQSRFTSKCIFPLLGSIIILASCQKKYLGPEVSYGTLFNRLVKMVVNSDDGLTTHSFTYDANGFLTTRTILLKGKNPSRTENSVEQYYRNGSGLTDSMKITLTMDGKVNAIEKRYFYYSGATQLSYSVVLHNANDPGAMRDSSVYTYNGNFLIERQDYTTSASIPASAQPYRDLVFQYSGTNISNLVFTNTVTGGTEQKTTIISFGYDTAKAALPLNGFQYGYDSVCFAWHDYAAANNLSSIKYGEGNGIGNVSYEYSYLANGHPFKAIRRETNVTGGTAESKIEFFYD